MFIESDSTTNTPSSEPGGGTPLYKLFRYVPPHRVCFLRRFGLKTDIHFAHFGLESAMVFEGTTGVCFRPNLSSDNLKARSENGYGF